MYTAWVPNMPCSSSNGDETGVCELVNTYTLIGTWIIPVLREYHLFSAHSSSQRGSLQSLCIAAASPLWSTVGGGALLQKLSDRNR